MKTKRMLSCAGVAALVALLAVTAWAAIGSGYLDEGFGSGGLVRVAVGQGELLGFAEQSDGKLIAAGWDTTDGTRRWRIRRFAADGSLDTTFGSSGLVSLFDGSGSDQVFDVEVDASDRILLAGYVQTTVEVSQGKGGKTKTETRTVSTVVRLLADGDLDTSFGDGGVLSLDVLEGRRIDDMLVQPDGKILLASSVFVTSGKGKDKTTSTAIAVVRLGTDGGPDTSFGVGGMAVDDVSGDNDVPHLHGLALQSDGSILVSFRRSSATWSLVSAWNIARYDSGGARDDSFGVDGIVTEFGLDHWQVAVDSQDRIVGVGTVSYGINDSDGVLIRYDVDGGRDTSFGDGGVYVTEISGRDVFINVAIAAGDQPVMAGGVFPQGGDVWVVDAVTIRLDADGTPDQDYGADGISEASSASDSRADFVRRFLIDGNGDYVVAGESHIINTSGSAQWLLVRWQQ